MISRIQILVFILAVLLGCLVQEWRYRGVIAEMQIAQSQALSKAQKNVRKEEHDRQAKAAKLDMVTQAAQDQVRVVTKVVEKEVIKYAEKNPSAGNCWLTYGWLRPHDTAARGLPQNSSASSKPDGATSPITDLDALRAVTNNYGQCALEYEKIKGLQAYVRDVCQAGQ